MSKNTPVMRGDRLLKGKNEIGERPSDVNPNAHSGCLEVIHGVNLYQQQGYYKRLD